MSRDAEVEARVRDVLAYISGRPGTDEILSVRLFDELGIDSLGVIAIFDTLEDHFGHLGWVQWIDASDVAEIENMSGSRISEFILGQVR